jgi:UDP-N-acetylglucosamine 2-epimerase (hydrolysing)
VGIEMTKNIEHKAQVRNPSNQAQENTTSEHRRKKILFITGTRADFGKLKSLMQEIENSADFDCKIFATGMHTLSRYDHTYNEIRKSGFKNIFTYINQDASCNMSMDIVLSNTIEGISRYIHEYPVDMIIVHGDRVESLAGAIVGSLNNILVTHIEGGERSGTVDELIRHAVSKLSHIHFVSNEEAKKRLIQMGEINKSIFVIGSPDIDIMLSESLPQLNQVKERYQIKFNKYGVFIYHPVTTEIDKMEKYVNNVIDALEEIKLNFVVIFPNNDSGSETVFKALKRLENNPQFRIFPSLRFEYFLTLLKNAEVIIGNSSAGIREAPVFGVPSINIGTRQDNRFFYPSIINVDADKVAIKHAFENLPKVHAPSFHFGDGKSATKFLKIINNHLIWETPVQKQFQDIYRDSF